MRAICGFALCLCVAVPGGVAAADPAPEMPSVFSRLLPDTDLAAERGRDPRADTQVTNAITIHGTADNISVNNAVTGNNGINGGAFAGAQGFPTVIQNTGNGVLIQNATIINVTIKP